MGYNFNNRENCDEFERPLKITEKSYMLNK